MGERGVKINPFSARPRGRAVTTLLPKRRDARDYCSRRVNTTILVAYLALRLSVPFQLKAVQQERIIIIISESFSYSSCFSEGGLKFTFVSCNRIEGKSWQRTW